jgi:cytoskeletal protein CcmA (bactofilin family)
MKTHSLKSLQENEVVQEADEDVGELVQDEDIRDSLGAVWVHEGDLTLDGELSVKGGALLVRGNLTVSESVATDETGTVLVTGDLTCRHLYLEGNLEVQGNANVRGVVYGFYEAGISRVLGTMKARIGLFGNHDWECEDEAYEVRARFSNYRALHEGNPEALRKALGEKAFAGLGQMMGLREDAAPEAANNAAWGLALLKDL